MTHRHDPAWRPFFDRAYGKRLRLEISDLKQDRDQMNNLALSPEYSMVAKIPQQNRMSELETTGDPRLTDDGLFFEDAEKFEASRKKK